MTPLLPWLHCGFLKISKILYFATKMHVVKSPNRGTGCRIIFCRMTPVFVTSNIARLRNKFGKIKYIVFFRHM